MSREKSKIATKFRISPHVFRMEGSGIWRERRRGREFVVERFFGGERGLYALALWVGTLIICHDHMSVLMSFPNDFRANETDMSTIHRLFLRLPPLPFDLPTAKSIPSLTHSLLTLPGAPSPVTSILYQKYRNSILILDDETQEIVSVVPLQSISRSGEPSESAGSTVEEAYHTKDGSSSTIRATNHVESPPRSTRINEPSIISSCDEGGSIISERTRRGTELLNAAMGTIEPYPSPPFFHELERSLASISTGQEKREEVQLDLDSTASLIETRSFVASVPPKDLPTTPDRLDDVGEPAIAAVRRPEEIKNAVLLSFLAGSSSIFAARDITSADVERNSLVPIGDHATKDGWKWSDLFWWRLGFGLGPFFGPPPGVDLSRIVGSGWTEWLNLNWFNSSFVDFPFVLFHTCR